MFQHGYVAVYQENDFCEIEGFPNEIENMSDNVVYIWEVVTRKEFMERGIAKKLLAYVLDKFSNYTIYSCINVNNIPSIRLHEKYVFKELYRFEEKAGNKIKQQIMFVKNADKSIDLE